MRNYVSTALVCVLFLGCSACSRMQQEPRTSPEKKVMTPEVAPIAAPAATGEQAEAEGFIITQPASPEVIQKLLAQVPTADTNELVDIIAQIGQLDNGSSNVLAVFSELLHHPCPDVRQAVLDAVFGFDVLDPLLPALIACLNDPDENVREDSADVLAEIESPEMLNAFVQGLTNDYPDVRENSEFYLMFWTDESYTNAVDWFAWWETNRTTFTFD